MILTEIQFENFIVFEELIMKFTPGVNVLIGGNKTGNTYVMKLLYAACQSSQTSKKVVASSRKIIKLFYSEDVNICKSLNKKTIDEMAKILIFAGENVIKVGVNLKTKIWKVEVVGEEIWEKKFAGLTSVFISSKEVISNSKEFINVIDKANAYFHDNYKSIHAAASTDISKELENFRTKKFMRTLQEIADNTFMDEKFYFKSKNYTSLDFQSATEILWKIAFISDLIKNDVLVNDLVLFLDEPETNISPEHIPVLVDMILSLQKKGVQIFITTYDYMFAEYLDLKSTPQNQIKFHSFYKADTKMTLESKPTFMDLEHNEIADAYNKMLDELFNMKSKNGRE